MSQAVQQVTAAAASQPEALSDDSAAVSALCVKLRDMLSHGLKPFVGRAAGGDWKSYLLPQQASPWALLQVPLPRPPLVGLCSGHTSD